MTKARLRSVLLGSALGLLAAPAIAHAGPNDNSAARPWSLNFGFGPQVSFGGGVVGKATPDFQYHFKGGDVGPALGAQAHMHFRNRLFGMNVGPIFMWDFRIYQTGNFKLYIAPLIAAGFGFSAFPHRNRGAVPFFFMDVGAQVKGLWNDWIGFFARPANFSVWAGDGFANGYWAFVGGITFSF